VKKRSTFASLPGGRGIRLQQGTFESRRSQISRSLAKGRKTQKDVEGCGIQKRAQRHGSLEKSQFASKALKGGSPKRGGERYEHRKKRRHSRGKEEKKPKIIKAVSRGHELLSMKKRPHAAIKEMRKKRRLRVGP